MPLPFSPPYLLGDHLLQSTQQSVNYSLPSVLLTLLGHCKWCWPTPLIYLRGCVSARFCKAVFCTCCSAWLRELWAEGRDLGSRSTHTSQQATFKSAPLQSLHHHVRTQLKLSLIPAFRVLLVWTQFHANIVYGFESCPVLFFHFWLRIRAEAMCKFLHPTKYTDHSKTILAEMPIGRMMQQ